MGVGHYENFPVGSLLLPFRLRKPVAAIYRFARRADDVADEGDRTPAERLSELRRFGCCLRRIEKGEPLEDALFVQLAEVIAQYHLPVGLFHALLDAFAQDVVKSRYEDFEELMDYSSRSADPVGRLMLHLYGAVSEETFGWSDRICSALQFINFWQDVAVDFAKGRIYLPRADMQRFGVTESQIAAGYATPEFRALLRFEVERTRAMLRGGAALGRRLTGRIGLELRMIIAGGDTILQKLLDVDCDVFRRRPVLRAGDWLSMFRYALFRDGTVTRP
jgi:squalene synthase HpnC